MRKKQDALINELELKEPERKGKQVEVEGNFHRRLSKLRRSFVAILIPRASSPH